MRIIIISLFCTILFSSCTNKTEDIKSPCVGIEKSPCGPKKPVNNWLS